MRHSHLKIAILFSLLLSFAGVTFTLAGEELPGLTGIKRLTESDTAQQQEPIQYRARQEAQLAQIGDIPVFGTSFKFRQRIQSSLIVSVGLRKQTRNQDCQDCVPQGDEHRYGQDDSQPGPQHRNQDCVPQDNENRNGQNNGQSGAPRP